MKACKVLEVKLHSFFTRRKSGQICAPSALRPLVPPTGGHPVCLHVGARKQFACEASQVAHLSGRSYPGPGSGGHCGRCTSRMLSDVVELISTKSSLARVSET
jgi:hypothetical protein